MLDRFMGNYFRHVQLGVVSCECCCTIETIMRQNNTAYISSSYQLLVNIHLQPISAIQ